MGDKLLVFILMLLSHHGTRSYAAMQSSHYYAVNTTMIQMRQLGPGWTKTKLMYCSLECSKMSKCSSFTYNKTSGLCVPGAGIGHSRDPVPFQGNLYVSGECDTQPGFTLHVSGSTKACLRLSSETLNFADANASCAAKGGYLTTPKTPEKISIMLSIARAQTERIWLGLDDRDVENVFRWHDDGSVLTAEQHQQLFHPDQPDNWLDNEDCVKYHPTVSLANDYFCQDELLYLCELPIPSRLH